MTYKNLSLIFIGTLLALVLLTQWLAINQFTQSISNQIGKSAFEVSRSTAEKLIFESPKIKHHEIKFFSQSSIPTNAKNQYSEQRVSQTINHVKKDITIQLIDKRKDKHLLLNADNENYKIPIPRTGIENALTEFSKKVFYTTISLLLVGLLVTYIFIHKLVDPLRQLQKTSEKISTGHWGSQVSHQEKWQAQEINRTIQSFNEMSVKILKLQQHNEKLQNQAHLVELTEISRGIAHTIRNPLNTLSFAIEALQNSEQAKRNEMIKIAKHQIIRIDKWVKSLMNIMTNDDSLKTKISLSDLLKAAVNELKLSAEKSIVFDLQLNSMPYPIIAIESELKGVIQSLITNAMESQNTTNIAINLSKNQHTYNLIITDNGIGISPEIFEHLFSPHNTNKTYGSGMGLYLAHRIITLKYNGTLELRNLKQGCECLLTLNNRS